MIDANIAVVISPLHLNTKTLIFALANPRVLSRHVFPVSPGFNEYENVALINGRIKSKQLRI